jgi:hypothetical protein
LVFDIEFGFSKEETRVGEDAEWTETSRTAEQKPKQKLMNAPGSLVCEGTRGKSRTQLAPDCGGELAQRTGGKGVVERLEL